MTDTMEYMLAVMLVTFFSGVLSGGAVMAYLLGHISFKMRKKKYSESELARGERIRLGQEKSKPLG